MLLLVTDGVSAGPILTTDAGGGKVGIIAADGRARLRAAKFPRRSPEPRRALARRQSLMRGSIGAYGAGESLDDASSFFFPPTGRPRPSPLTCAPPPPPP